MTAQKTAEAGVALLPELKERHDRPIKSDNLYCITPSELQSIIAALELLRPVAAGTHDIARKGATPTDGVVSNVFENTVQGQGRWKIVNWAMEILPLLDSVDGTMQRSITKTEVKALARAVRLLAEITRYEPAPASKAPTEAATLIETLSRREGEARKAALEEAAGLADKDAERAKVLMERAQKRARLSFPGDIRDHDNDAAGCDGMYQMALGLGEAIRTLIHGEAKAGETDDRND